MKPRPKRAPPTRLSVAGSGTAPTVPASTCPSTVVSPAGLPELGAASGVGEKTVKIVEWKLPLSTTKGLHVIMSWLESLKTVPPLKVPVKCPVAASVVSLMFN